MDYDKMIEQGTLAVEKSTIVDVHGETVPVAQVTIKRFDPQTGEELEPFVQTATAEELMQQLADLHVQMAPIKQQIDYMEKIRDTVFS